MILESISFHNYRQFKGNQNIKFSTDPDKNVTVIIGQNTFGKTTIVQAFIWCLYGSVDFKDKNMLNAEAQSELLNKAVGEKDYASVKVKFNHNGTNYLVERRENVFVKSLNKLDKSISFNIYECDDNGNTVPMLDRQPDEIINEILPQNLSDYFFLWGERIETLSEKSNLSDAVKQFLGLDTLASCIKHLDLAQKQLIRDMPTNGEGEISELKENISRCEKDIEKLEIELKEAENNLNFYDEKSKQYFEELMTSDNKALSNNQDKYQEKCNQMESLKNQLESAKKVFFQNINDENNYPYYLSNTIEKKAVNVLKNNPEPTVGWKYIDVNVINEIINRKECICGSPICKDSDAYNHLIDQKQVVAPNVTGGVINSFVEEAERRESFNSNYYRLIHSNYKKIVDLQEDINNLQLEIDKLEQAIFNKPDMKVLKRKYEQSLDDKNSFVVKVSSLKSQIDNDLADIDRYQNRINNLTSKDKKFKKYSNYLNITKQLYALFSKQYKESETVLKNKLVTYVNEDFEKVYNGERKIEIDDKYVSHPLAYIGGKWQKTETTPGLETVKNFAFITGLVRCAKEKINGEDGETVVNPNSYPLVLDAPFSQADEKHVPAICDLIAENAEQIILVVMEKDWDYAKNTLNSKTGNYYRLYKTSETHSEIKEDKNI